MHARRYLSRKAQMIQKRQDPPLDRPSDSSGVSQAAEPTDKDPQPKKDEKSLDSQSSTSIESSSESSAPATSSTPDKVEIKEPAITETPLIIAAAPPKTHDSAELNNLRQAYNSIYSQAVEANAKSFTSNANVYGNWAGQLSQSIMAVEAILATQSDSQTSEGKMPDTQPTTSATRAPNLAQPPGQSYSSTKIVIETQSADEGNGLALSTGAITGIAIASAIVIVIIALAISRPCSRRSGPDKRLQPRRTARIRGVYDDIPEMSTKDSEDNFTPSSSRTQLVNSAAAIKSAPFVSSPARRLSPQPPTNRLKNVVQSIKRTVSHAPENEESQYAEVVDGPSLLRRSEAGIAYVPPALRAGARSGNNTSSLTTPKHASGERSSKLPNPFSSDKSAYT